MSAASRRRRRDVVVAMWDAALAALSLAVIVASIAGAWWMLKIAEAR